MAAACATLVREAAARQPDLLPGLRSQLQRFVTSAVLPQLAAPTGSSAAGGGGSEGVGSGGLAGADLAAAGGIIQGGLGGLVEEGQASVHEW